MSQAHSVPAEALFLSAAEIWRSTQSPEIARLVDESKVPLSTEQAGSVAASRIGQFVAERLWKVLEATVIQPHAESGTSQGAVLSIPWYSKANRDLSLLVRSLSNGGTLEVWHVDPDRDELRLSSGYFGRWDEFRRITASTRFPKGSGLPGRVWLTEQPVLFEDLSESKAFLRAEAAQSIGLQFGIGLPVHYPSGMGVVVLLSSVSAPLARSIDIWRHCNPGEVEHLHGLSLCMTAQERTLALATAQDLALRSATEFSPQVLPTGSKMAHSVSSRPFDFGCAWPSSDRSGVVHVATLVG